MTSLSHAEAVLGYETLEDPSLYYKVRASDGSYLVIWTTMPFTVVTDEMVGVKPDAELRLREGGRTRPGSWARTGRRPSRRSSSSSSARRSRSSRAGTSKGSPTSTRCSR